MELTKIESRLVKATQRELEELARQAERAQNYASDLLRHGKSYATIGMVAAQSEDPIATLVAMRERFRKSVSERADIIYTLTNDPDRPEAVLNTALQGLSPRFALFFENVTSI